MYIGTHHSVVGSLLSSVADLLLGVTECHFGTLNIDLTYAVSLIDATDAKDGRKIERDALRF